MRNVLLKNDTAADLFLSQRRCVFYENRCQRLVRLTSNLNLIYASERMDSRATESMSFRRFS